MQDSFVIVAFAQRGHDPVSNILQTAFKHAEWLALRRTVTASNVANANSPGYRAQDVVPFADVLRDAGTAPRLTITNSAHQSVAASAAGEAGVVAGDSHETYHSGNSVNLDEEMMKAGQIAQQQALNAGVVKAFHRMLLASAKG